MIWIEIIGPSGVGKSYWYEKFMKQYPEYEPKQLALTQIYKSEEFNKSPLKIKILFWIYRLNFYRVSNHFKHKLFSFFLKRFQRNSRTIFIQKDDIIIKKYLENVDTLKEPQIVVLKQIDYFHQKLMEFKFYEFYLEENDIYIAEDGLMHLSPVFIEELQADMALIFEKNYETLVKQRLLRARKKPSTFIEFLLKEKDLKNYIQDYYELYAVKIESIFKNYKVSKAKLIDLDKVDVLKEIHESVTRIQKLIDR